MLSILVTLAYLFVAGLLLARCFGRTVPCKLIFFSACAAIIAHGFLLHHWIDGGVGQNLTLFNVASFTTWLIALLITISAIKHPTANLGIFIFPVAALSILLAQFFPGDHVLFTGDSPKQLFHVLFSLLTFSVLGMATVQASLGTIQEKRLRHHQTGGFVQFLPPIETMEKLLSQMLIIGFVLLTTVLITSVFSFENIFLPPLLNKTIFVFLAWGVFAALIWGHKIAGWRGRVAFQWTISGMGLLFAAYFLVWAIAHT